MLLLIGHRDSLYQPLLAQALPYASVRMEFNPSAPYNSLQNNVQDLSTVTTYFKQQGYTIEGIVGHSNGAMAALKYATTCEQPLPHLVSIAPRYTMEDIDPDTYLSQIYDAMAISEKDKVNKDLLHQITEEEKKALLVWDNSHGKYFS
ncbi:hypothetical protein BDF14DRAFT_202394 [Spinellus fusiger]|nr:hypothetical protein BDF14DRAFT_202394 [Spinellus fusiger]